MSDWASVEQARQDWPDAPASDATLLRLLGDAQAQCEAYAPTLAEDADTPAGYARAVVLQARELWASARRDGDVIGTDTYAVRAWPLTGAVKALLRPKRGRLTVR